MFDMPCSLPTPTTYIHPYNSFVCVHQDRILTNADSAPASNKPGVRATTSIWGWLGWICRLWIHYRDQDGHHCFINKVSAQKFLQRHNIDNVNSLNNRSIKKYLEGFVTLPSPSNCTDDADAVDSPCITTPSAAEESISVEVFTSIDAHFAKNPDEVLNFFHKGTQYQIHAKHKAYYIERGDTIDPQVTAELGSIERIKIQKDNKGNIVSIDMEGNADEDTTAEKINELAEEVLRCAAIQVQRQHTTYKGSGVIEIAMVQDLLTVDSAYQLETFVNILADFYDSDNGVVSPALRVDFLTSSLNYGPAIDNGGLSREFLEMLAAGIAKENEAIAMQLTHDDTLAAPTSLASYVEGSCKLPKLGVTEWSCLNNLGKLFYFCWNSNKNSNKNKDSHFFLGRHYDESLFALIASFEAMELQKDSSILNEARVLELFAVMAEADEDQVYQDLIALINTPQDQLTDEQLNNAGYRLDDESFLLDDGYTPDKEKIKAGWQDVYRKLVDCAYEKYAGRLVAGHEIARGMKSFAESNKDRWKTNFYKTDATELSTRIQGSIDRDAIAFSIEVQNGNSYNDDEKKVLEQKIDWLREWILDENTPDSEIKAFLRFAIGQSSMPPNREINIQKQYSDLSPVPKAHTCSFVLEFAAEYVRWESKDKKDCYHDFDKEGFIKSLRTWALGLEGFQML